MKDLKLSVALVNKLSGDLKKLADDMRRQAEKANADALANAKRASDTAQREQEKLAKERIRLQRASISQEEKVQAQRERELARMTRRANESTLRESERAARERIRLQRTSIAQEEKLQAQRAREAAREEEKAARNTLQVSRNQQEAAQRIQRQAALAEASLVVDRFDRRIAIEKARHLQIMGNLRGNHAAMEAEVRRHNAVVNRVQMDKANLPNTPFQRLLASLTGGGGVAGQATAGLAAGLRNVGSAALGMAGPLGIAALAAFKLSQMHREAYRAADEQARADRSLQAILRATGNTAGGTFEDLSALAGGYQKVTEFQDDTVQGAQAVLLQFDKIGSETFPRALQAAVDFASFTGTDLVTATRDLGQALQDPEAGARKLRTMNIMLTASEKDLLKTWNESGRTKEAQAFILEKLESRVKGHAESTARSTAKLKNAIGELYETMGTPLVAAAEMGAQAILDFGGAIAKANEQAAKGQALAFGVDVDKLQAQAKARDDARKKNLQDIAAAKKEEEARAGGPTEEQKEHLKKMLADEAEERRKAAEADAEFNREAAADFVMQKIRTEDEARRKIREAAKADQDAALAEDVKRTEQIYAARARVDMEGAGDDRLAQMEVRHRQEQEAAAGNETALTLITRAQGMERARIEKTIAKETADKVVAEENRKKQAQAQLYSAAGQFLGALAAQNKEFFLLQQAVALGEVIFNTGKAVTAAGAASPLTFGQPWAGYAMGLGALQAATIAAQTVGGMEGYARGTDFAPGGMAWVGESGPELMEVPRGAKVHTAGESDRMASVTSAIDMGGIHITIQGHADKATVRQIETITNRELRQMARRIEMIRYRGIKG